METGDSQVDGLGFGLDLSSKPGIIRCEASILHSPHALA